ncbi:unnamed protein product [Mytilus coruscus]|uniref:Uncharacterized protein n=1 Tax=Mytilus coruscus TaxID=42192 RepID=A0A6J8F000_MYTCO|nr:unnamed protein product [Mytilus coruscus]
MASRPNSRNQPYSNRHLDLNNPENWTSQQLRIKVQQLGIVVPKNVAKTVLKQFYLENKDRQNSNGNIAQNEEHVSDPEHVVLNPIAQHSGSASASACASDSTANVTDGLRNPTADESSSRSDVNESTGSAQFDSVGDNNMAAIIQSFSIVSQSVAQCASGLQQTVSLIANQKNTESGPAKKFGLAQWYQNRNMEDVPLAVHGSVQNRPTLPLSTTPSLGYLSTALCPTAGVRSDAFSNVDIVAPSLQRSIIEAKAAALLRERYVKVDWSLRDRDILSLITAGSSVNVCKICNLIDHATQYCPLQSSVQVENSSSRSYSSSNLQSVDKQGRSRVFHEGREMCNNFNNPKGCYRKVCYLLHQCTKCRATGHGAATCRKSNSNVPVHSSTSSVSSKGNKLEKPNSG